MVLSLILFLIGFSFLIIGIIMSKGEKDFEDKSINGVAVVSGYDTTEQSSRIDLLVFIVGIEPQKSVLCHSKKLNSSDFPVGTKVKVKYLEKNLFGMKYYDVRLDEEGLAPPSEMILGKVFTILGATLLIFCTAFVIISLLGGL